MARGVLGGIALTFLLFLRTSTCQDPCVIDVDCDQCFPEHLPYVASHRAVDGVISVPHGEEVTLHCHRSKLKLRPKLNSANATCDSGLFRLLPDETEPRQLGELGCQTDYFEDVMHQVDGCDGSMQGRSYQYRDELRSRVRHLVETCYDPIEGRTLFARMTLSNDNEIVRGGHVDDDNKISFLETLGRMTDDAHKLEAEAVYSNDEVMNRKLRSLMGRGGCNLAGQQLVAAKMLPTAYFTDQNGVVAKFPSNKAAVWGSVARGNLKHIQDDVRDAFFAEAQKNGSDVVDVYAGTHGVLSLPFGAKEREIHLKPGRLYPVPKYVYTIVQNRSNNRGIALVVVNNPFLSVSDIRSTVFCPSMCGSVAWLNKLKQANNYERIAYGLVFCCDLHSFSNIVGDGPKLLAKIHAGEAGLLKKLR